jgi:hypothetical protein
MGAATKGAHCAGASTDQKRYELVMNYADLPRITPPGLDAIALAEILGGIGGTADASPVAPASISH